MGDCEPESNGNKEMILHSADLQKWNLTIKCNLVIHLGHHFLGGDRVRRVI